MSTILDETDTKMPFRTYSLRLSWKSLFPQWYDSKNVKIRKIHAIIAWK